MCWSKILRGVEPAKIKTGVWKPRIFRLKTGFFRKIYCENPQKHQKRPTFYGKFREIPVFRKLTPALPSLSTVFQTAWGGGNPPKPSPVPTHMYGPIQLYEWMHRNIGWTLRKKEGDLARNSTQQGRAGGASDDGLWDSSASTTLNRLILRTPNKFIYQTVVYLNKNH